MKNRREFIGTTGAALVAAPFINALAPKASRAQGVGGRAKRLLIYFTPDGVIPSLWRPTIDGQSFTFPETSVLTPLQNYRQDLLYVDGLDFKTGNNHEGGMAAMLTNGHTADSVTNGMSIDQFVAGHIGSESRFQSMEFGILTDPWGASIQTRMCYSGPGQFVHPDSDPQSVFRRMFGALSQDEAALARVRARRRSVLDLIRDELNALKPRIGRAEQVKLDRHLDGIRSVERTLFPAEGQACTRPAAPPRMDKDDYSSVPQITRSQMDLAVTALGCDMTRVATIQLSHTVSPVVFSWVGNTNGHHDLSHADDADLANVAQIRDADRWCAEQFAYLIDKLKATPNPSGEGTLFDDTLIVWAKELGDSRLHVCESVPFIFAGTAGGAIRPGRYLNFPRESHSKLLVSICHAMGIDVDTYGDPRTGNGPLGGLS